MMIGKEKPYQVFGISEKNLYKAFNGAKDLLTKQIIAQVIWSNNMEDDVVRLFILRVKPTLFNIYKVLYRSKDEVVRDFAIDLLEDSQFSACEVFHLRYQVRSLWRDNIRFDFDIISEHIDKSQYTIYDLKSLDRDYKPSFSLALEGEQKNQFMKRANELMPNGFRLRIEHHYVAFEYQNKMLRLSAKPNCPEELCVRIGNNQGFPRRKRNYNSMAEDMRMLFRLVEDYMERTNRTLSLELPSPCYPEERIRADINQAHWALKNWKWYIEDKNA
jgi:hypothetical protein